jgi:hypothetical protein
MGFDTNAIKFLFEIKKNNIELGKTLTLGRQSYQLHENHFIQIANRYGLNKETVISLLQKDNVYTEPFLKALGATEVHSIDASSYESATIIHDMNLSIPAELKNQYDTVIDAGTLEHIFNFPKAIKNCMEMLKVNGTFVGISITNNFFGHGFYQFSPELFFRVFSEENGFKIKKLLLAVNEPESPWYEIPDPQSIQKRVIFENSKQTFLLILAKKETNKIIFHHIPQQSDYEHLSWQGRKSNSKKKSFLKRILLLIPSSSKNNLRKKLRILDPITWKIFLRNTGNGDKKNFKKVKNI